MRIHYLQHVPFEDLGSIKDYLLKQKCTINSTKLYKNEKLPNPQDFDWLIIMGGPMGVDDEKKYPWLIKEKKFILDTIEDSSKTILGICLGAQLIANVLKAKVYKNKYKEIGWFNIVKSSELKGTILDDVFPNSIEAFHWHGDTFEIPKEAKLIASSDACKNQGFIIDNRIIGFQFHLETTLESATKLIKNCRQDLDNSKYVQSEKEILSNSQKFTLINKLMKKILNKLLTK
ncbi:GMP synthase-Glutamine amidotransferase [Desulfonauticus submarinus]|uniref:GMP synthase-Glutamine amidotransferase n=1 Tax=Desulfonauticus submarinus TaxID=206665 RepID=A0A1H0F9T4_9BACT|nr:type 1 glutamine amidotransferase [Desulfonauticus submarinus]SDN91356.1 GMP synthase-Glutamine amidotransferase [Desulfonauticus submarinus]